MSAVKPLPPAMVAQGWVWSEAQQAHIKIPHKAPSSRSFIAPVVSPLPLVQNAKESHLEAKFMRLWIEAQGPTLEREAKLLLPRKFRCDFYHEASKVIIECEGGIWLGRHTSGNGFQIDAEKYYLLTLAGFTIFRLTPHLIKPDVIQKIISFIAKKTIPSKGKQKGWYHE